MFMLHGIRAVSERVKDRRKKRVYKHLCDMNKIQCMRKYNNKCAMSFLTK